MPGVRVREEATAYVSKSTHRRRPGPARLARPGPADPRYRPGHAAAADPARARGAGGFVPPPVGARRMGPAAGGPGTGVLRRPHAGLSGRLQPLGPVRRDRPL